MIIHLLIAKIINYTPMNELNQDDHDQPGPTPQELETRRRSWLRKEITAAINKNCAENGSDTPDFILASYMLRCLEAFDLAVMEREAWYGRRGTQAHLPTSPPVAANRDEQASSNDIFTAGSVCVPEIGMTVPELVEHYRMSIKTLKKCREYVERIGFGHNQFDVLAQINICVSSVTPDFA